MSGLFSRKKTFGLLSPDCSLILKLYRKSLTGLNGPPELSRTSTELLLRSGAVVVEEEVVLIVVVTSGVVSGHS